MSKIPKALLREILLDPWYRECCLKSADCEGRVEFHHNLIYGGKQVQKLFAILPVCSGHHEDANYPEIRERMDHIMLHRATREEILMFSKAVNLQLHRDTLDKKYGIPCLL